MTSSSAYLQIPEGRIFWVLHHPAKLPLSSAASPDYKRPLLLFVHAGVADHTLWDGQVAYFTARGWSVCRFDILGYGKSIANETYLQQKERPKVAHHEYFAALVKEVQRQGQSPLIADSTRTDKVVIIGLSRGGSHAVDFAVAYPDLCAGLVVVAGGLSGCWPPNTAAEDALCEKEAQLMADKDLEGAVDFNIHFWGDGPLQPPHRASPEVRSKLRGWCRESVSREMSGIGGFAIPFQNVTPPAAERLDDIQCPIAVAIGKFDETSTSEAMRVLAKRAKHVTSTKEFETAHMVNLEAERQFNEWLDEWL